jgi:4-carboxymuconolactone decarboxylase
MKTIVTGCIGYVAILLISCNHAKDNNTAQSDRRDVDTIFPIGSRITNENFTGTAWLQMLVENDTAFNTTIGSVIFEPGARTNWHYHPGGQILLVTSGIGRYQEKGMAMRELRKGDVIKCAPNTIHWHGAAPNTGLSHIAIGPNSHKGAVVWLQQVTAEEYDTDN